MAINKKQLENFGFKEVKEDGAHYFEYVFDKKNYESSSALVTNDVQDNVGEDEEIYQVHLMGVRPEKSLSVEQVSEIINIYGDEE